MHVSILSILKGTLTGPALYKATAAKGNRDREKEGGLGEVFQKNTRHYLITEALDINDVMQTYSVKDLEKLEILANRFHNGDAEINQNYNKFAFCLALIYQHSYKQAKLQDRASDSLKRLETLYRTYFKHQSRDMLYTITNRQQELALYTQNERYRSTSRQSSLYPSYYTRHPSLAIQLTPPVVEAQPPSTTSLSKHTAKNSDSQSCDTNQNSVNSPLVQAPTLQPLPSNFSMSTLVLNDEQASVSHPAPAPTSLIANTISENPPPPRQTSSQSLTASSNPAYAASFEDILNQMHEKLVPTLTLTERKNIQQKTFESTIKTLPLLELKKLCLHMYRVQRGEITDSRFDLIRQEQFYCFGSGNTNTWRSLFNQVKKQILEQLAAAPEAFQASKQEYNQLSTIMNLHTGRWYGRWGKTASYHFFITKFKPVIQRGEQPAQKPIAAISI